MVIVVAGDLVDVVRVDGQVVLHVPVDEAVAVGYKARSRRIRGALVVNLLL